MDKYAHLREMKPKKRMKAALSRWKMCAGKKMYETKEEAEKKMWGDVKYFYHCPLCKFFHLTSKH